jgi:GH24 family phage-related lysozyme (muramidase)
LPQNSTCKKIAVPAPTPQVGDVDKEAIAIAAEYCRLTEVFEADVYPDPKSGAEPYTCGYGSTRNLDGNPWVMGQSCTEAEAEWMLMRDVGESERSLSGSIPHWKNLGFAIQSALLSLAYNTGYFFEDGKHATLDQFLRQRQWRNIPRQLLEYRDDDCIEGDRGVELGVARRRLGEAYLCKGYSPKDAYDQAWGFDSVAEILKAIA